MARNGSILPVALLALAAASMMVMWSTSLYVPSGNAPGRRQALQSLAGAAAATFGAQAAWADAYGSKPWALTKYAPRVVGLKGAIDSGDFKSVLEREGTFKALNGYWMFSPEEYAVKNKLVSDLMEAAETGDKTKTSQLYDQYMNDQVMQEWQRLAGDNGPGKRAKRNIMTVQRSLFTGQQTAGSVDGRGL